MLPISFLSLLAPAIWSEPPPGPPDAEGPPVYLVYAGPYSGSPASAFGHLFLVTPQDSEEPLPLWDVLSFSAETYEAGTFRYFSKGIVGGFLGSYQRLDFHEKSRDYEVLEDRDLWLVELKLTASQRTALDRTIQATEGMWYPYTFFSKNCAYYLQLVLAEAISEIEVPAGTVSPAGVVKHVLQTEVAGQTYFRPALTYRLRDAAENIDPAVTSRLEGGAWRDAASDQEWLRSLTPSERSFVQEYFSLRALGQETLLGAQELEGLALLRVLNVTDPVGPGNRDSQPGSPTSSPNFHGYSRASFSYWGSADESSRVSLRYRGAIHSEDDPWQAHRPINTMEILSLEVSSSTVEFQPRIEEVTLFTQRALRPRDWLTSKSSWMLEALGRHGGLLDGGSFHLEARGGVGLTKALLGRVMGYGLGTAGIVGTWRDDLTVAPGLELGGLALLSSRWRTGARWSREYDVRDFRVWADRVNAWVRYDVSDRSGLAVSWTSAPSGAFLRIRTTLYW